MADQRLSASTVRALAAAYPDWDAESVVRIAWRESNFVPTVIADDSDDLSYGLMQLNMKEGTANIPQLRQMYGITRNEELLNPVVNMRAAHALWLASGKSFIPGWKYVPPTKNYPDTGGSTTVPNADDQGNPNPPNIDLDDDGTKDIYIADWGANDASNWHTFKQLYMEANPIITTFKWNAAVRRSVTAGARLGVLPGGGQATDSMKTTLAKIDGSSSLNVSEDALSETIDSAQTAFEGLTGWMAGLGKLLSTLTSLSFWKKVGVGFLALLLIISAVMIFNKDKALPIITKGAVDG